MKTYTAGLSKKCFKILRWYSEVINRRRPKKETNNDLQISVRENRMDNPEKLATFDRQDEDKQNVKHSTIYVGPQYTQTNTNNINKT